MSAGPLEGLGELDRFFGEVHALPDWTFAAALRAAGLTDDDLPGLLANPVIAVEGERGTAFDLTEGLNAEAAAAPAGRGPDRLTLPQTGHETAASGRPDLQFVTGVREG